MDTAPAFGSKELFGHAIIDMAKAVSERTGESQEQQFSRYQTAIHMLMAFRPRDVAEVLLAGHCMMLHEGLIAEIRYFLGSEKAARGRGLITLNKAFNDTLIQLERYQLRPPDERRDTPETPPDIAAPTETAVPVAKPAAARMNRAARRQAARAESRASRRETDAPAPGATGVVSPQPPPESMAG